MRDACLDAGVNTVGEQGKGKDVAVSTLVTAGSGRRWWRVAMALAWMAVLASAFSMVWARHEARQQFQELQALKRDRDELNIEWNQLRLELGALAAHWRVERLAREQLSMREPEAGEMRWVDDDED
ncbi:MAG: cell division protein FtsL [Pseudomonadota bacterium]